MSPPSQPEPIAIIGAACRLPGGASSPSKLWDLLSAPRDLLSKIPPDRFDPDGFYHPDGEHHGATNVRHAYLLSEDPRHFDAAFFSINPREAEEMDPGSAAVNQPVKDLLAACKNASEAENILCRALSAKLATILQLSADAINKNTPLVDLGVDSLIAIQVQAWFLKELHVDVPMLKVIGGGPDCGFVPRSFEQDVVGKQLSKWFCKPCYSISRR
ncbi:hypothetical protein VTN96DRAFT_277 [Rasamsonia emersonii]